MHVGVHAYVVYLAQSSTSVDCVVLCYRLRMLGRARSLSAVDGGADDDVFSTGAHGIQSGLTGCSSCVTASKSAVMSIDV